MNAAQHAKVSRSILRGNSLRGMKGTDRSMKIPIWIVLTAVVGVIVGVALSALIVWLLVRYLSRRDDPHQTETPPPDSP